MKNKKPVMIAGGSLLLAILLALLVRSRQEPVTADLPDGTRFRLAMSAYTNRFSYSQSSKPDWLKPLSPLIPDSLENRFLTFGSTISLGNSPETNLMIVIESVNERNDLKSIDRLRIRDDEGNIFDGSHANGMMSSDGMRNSIYVARVLPKRSKNLQVEVLVRSEESGWTNIGPFSIANPMFREYPQWVPEPLPQEWFQNEFSATLTRFESGPGSERLTGSAPPSNATPRSTFMEFSFADRGVATDDYRVHWIRMSDATGNKWIPHFDYINQTGSAWVNHGMTEFIGGAWQGEDAWKIEMEAIPTAGFPPAEVWDVPPIALPPANQFAALTNRFVVDDSTNILAVILAPGVQITNRWQWTVRYWGDEKDVYPIALECLNQGMRRAVIVEATSEAGADFKIHRHQNVNHSMQSIFVSPPGEGASELNLKIAFPKLKSFEFIARPKFVEQVQSGG